MAQITLIDEKPSPKITLQTSVRDYDPFIAAAAKKYSLDPLMLRAVMQVESGGNANIEGPPVGEKKERAGGLFQLMPATARALGVTNVFDPEQNIDGGARYLRQQLDHPSAQGDMSTGLMFYHGGRDPNNWGERSFAYPGLVLDAYRKLGGRLQDPAVPEGKFWQRMTAAALPLDLMARTALGRGPDLSQGGGNRPVGAKIGDWWDSVSPGRATFQRSMDNYADNNPILSATADVLGSLPAGLGIGNLLTAALKGTRMLPSLDRVGSYFAGPTGQVPGGIVPAGATAAAVAPWRTFVGGGAGRGLPATGEGASIPTQMASGGTLGVAQGAVQGAGWSGLNPNATVGESAGIGALVGGGVGAVVPPVAAAAARTVFGPRIAKATADLGESTRTGAPGQGPFSDNPTLEAALKEAGILPPPSSATARPPLTLTPDLAQSNRLSLDPNEYTRKVLDLVGEPPVPTVVGGKLVNARRAIGFEFDESTKGLQASLDQQFFSGWDALIAASRGDANLTTAIDKLPAVKALGKRISYLANMEDGIMTGKEYQSLTRLDGAVSKLANNSNLVIAEFGRGLRTLLDDALERGTGEKIQLALTQVKNATERQNPAIAAQAMKEAEQTVASYVMYKVAKQKYRMLAPIENAINPVTKQIDMRRLHAGGEKVAGPLEEVGRAGLAFNPQSLAANTKQPLSYSAIATLGGLASQDHVNTGQAALALGGGGMVGRAAQRGIMQIPGYTSGYLRRNQRFGPGPLADALQTVGRSAAPISGVRSNPLLEVER